MDSFSRRIFIAGAGAVALSGCVSQPMPEFAAEARREASGDPPANIDPIYAEIYGPILEEPFPLEAIDLGRIDPAFLRKVVSYSAPEAAWHRRRRSSASLSLSRPRGWTRGTLWGRRRSRGLCLVGCCEDQQQAGMA
jgi:hypothetical protein